MMVEARKDITVGAKTEGLDKASRDIDKVIGAARKANESQTKGFAGLTKSTDSYKNTVKELERELKSLASKQLDVNKALSGVEKGSDLYGKLKDRLKSLNEEFSKTARLASNVRMATAEGPVTASEMRRGGFSQGFLQGAAPGIAQGLQRGPGMGRQAVGMAVGGMARGAAGAALGGVGGALDGISKIPVIGGLTAAALRPAFGFAQQALGLERQRMEMVPGLVGRGGVQRARQARGKLASLSEDTIESQAAEAGRMAWGYEPDLNEEMRKQFRSGNRAEARNISLDIGAGKSGEVSLRLRDEAQTKAEEETRARLREQRKVAGGELVEAINKPFRRVRGAGQNILGISEQQALSQANVMTQVGGGGLEDLQQQGLLETGFAAQRTYGVGAATSGAFLQAGRVGGAVGAKGRGGEALADTIGDALSLGLQGSEIPQYLQEMASGISQWKSTGIPIASGSIASMGRALAVTGVGGVRGQRIASSVQQYTSTIGKRGVQSTEDLMALQAVGFKGGGSEDYVKALTTLEAGGFKGKQLKEFVANLSKAGGGGATGALTVRKGLSSVGADVSMQEALDIQAGKNVKSIQRKISAGRRAAPQSADDMIKDAKDIMTAWGSSSKKQAKIQNDQLDVGATLVTTMQNLDVSVTNVAKTAGALSKDILEPLTTGLASVTKDVAALAEGLPEILLWVKRHIID